MLADGFRLRQGRREEDGDAVPRGLRTDHTGASLAAAPKRRAANAQARSAAERSLCRRGRWVAAVHVLALLGLIVRLTDLQALSAPGWRHQARRQQARTESLPARPGEIYDARGNLLATSIEVYSLYADPKEISDAAQAAEALAGALGLDRHEVQQRLGQDKQKRFVWIKRRLGDDEVRRVQALGLPRTWIGFRKEFRRCYPQEAVAAHVIGLRDIDGVGQDGVERTCDAQLQGQEGRRVVVHDAVGRTLTILEEETRLPEQGRRIVLTLDLGIQTFAERALDRVMQQWKPKSACAIVMDPKTGEILAMASRPALVPDELGTSPVESWRNAAIADVYEPGSTFKPFVTALALERGIVHRDESFFCENGLYHLGRRLLRDHHPYGELGLADVLVKSSNIGMAKIGERMGNDNLYAAVKAFGFGEPTGIELPGEASGFVQPLEKWTSYSTGSVPMGQEIGVTPLQLIRAFSALANGGKLLRPRIIRGFATPDGRTLRQFHAPVVVGQAASAEVARWLVDPVMREVVERGTGQKARLANYRVFGKTGTGQKPDPDTGGYSNRLHVSSFVAGAPLVDPCVVALVMVNEPSLPGEHFGGRVAAPAVGEILQSTLVYLRIPPDKSAKPPKTIAAFD